eukprot:EG_transcript_22069
MPIGPNGNPGRDLQCEFHRSGGLEAMATPARYGQFAAVEYVPGPGRRGPLPPWVFDLVHVRTDRYTFRHAQGTTGQHSVERAACLFCDWLLASMPGLTWICGQCAAPFAVGGATPVAAHVHIDGEQGMFLITTCISCNVRGINDHSTHTRTGLMGVVVGPLR